MDPLWSIFSSAGSSCLWLSRWCLVLFLFFSECNVLTKEIELLMKKWLKSFFIFLIGFWFCGKLDFISLPSVLDCIVAYPHTKRKHATCVLDLILELAIHPVFSQNVGLQTSGGLLSHFCSGFLGSSLFSVLLLSTLSQILLHTPLSL